MAHDEHKRIRALMTELLRWRAGEAGRLGVPLFRVLSHDALREVAVRVPRTKDELLSIKGIKEKKFFQYGVDILRIVSGTMSGDDSKDAPDFGDISERSRDFDRTYSVSEYLSAINGALASHSAYIAGEVSSFDARGTYLFFGLKDKTDGSTLYCFMWMSDYKMAGHEIEIGDEIAVVGTPEVYKPAGRLSFRVSGISLLGEGALKKAYDALRKKLEKEGLFDAGRKRPLPEFPRRIGLVTSRTGAVIGDFLNNLERWGFSARFVHARVEGAHAVSDILSALQTLAKDEVDVLVIIRGGGSMESLQAFNNELIVRAIVAFPAPVVCGIGHDKDVPLATLASDHTASTPTATAVLLSSQWREAWRVHEATARKMADIYSEALFAKRRTTDLYEDFLKRRMGHVTELMQGIWRSVTEGIVRVAEEFSHTRHSVTMEGLRLSNFLTRGIDERKARLSEIETALSAWDPRKALARGYAIVRAEGGKVLASARHVRVGARVDISLSDGTIKATVVSSKIR